VEPRFDEREAQFSPDGKWIAYQQTNDSGNPDIYVQPFPGPGGTWQISTNGGHQVRWRPDGKELFYMDLDTRLMAVKVQLHSEGQTLDKGLPVPLFTSGAHLLVNGVPLQNYVVSKDGQRFLMLVPAGEARTPVINVILNWKGRP
jgi:Tol biopolymer transport system component